MSSKVSCCIKRVKNIASGWAQLLLIKPHKIAKVRLIVCRNCKSNRWGGRRMWCKECGCYIPAKVRVKDEVCPLKKWVE
jgi:hypothetical protein